MNNTISSELTHIREIKLERVQGGCLGIRSRRRTRQAAISCGEEQISYDPQISEWGNPVRQYLITVYLIHRYTEGHPLN